MATMILHLFRFSRTDWYLDRPRNPDSIKNHKKMGNYCIYKAIGYYIPFELKVTSSDPLGDVTPITIILVDLAT